MILLSVFPRLPFPIPFLNIGLQIAVHWNQLKNCRQNVVALSISDRYRIVLMQEETLRKSVKMSFTLFSSIITFGIVTDEVFCSSFAFIYVFFYIFILLFLEGVEGGRRSNGWYRGFVQLDKTKLRLAQHVVKWTLPDIRFQTISCCI